MVVAVWIKYVPLPLTSLLYLLDSVAIAVAVKGIVFSGCATSHSHKRDFFRFVTNIHLDSRMNLLESGGQRAQTSQHIFDHNVRINLLIMTTFHPNI